MSSLRTFWTDEEGATAIEYGLIAALVSVVIIVALTTLGTQLRTQFCEVVEALGGTCPQG
ncbi:MAG: Flp family type IVb pilin [Geminicoccaceae bacterium]|nr:Flp family type IVb pilin [Geminicoccaceae bacterium]